MVDTPMFIYYQRQHLSRIIRMDIIYSGDLTQEIYGILGTAKYRCTIEIQKHKYRNQTQLHKHETRLDPAMTLYSMTTSMDFEKTQQQPEQQTTLVQPNGSSFTVSPQQLLPKRRTYLNSLNQWTQRDSNGYRNGEGTN